MAKKIAETKKKTKKSSIKLKGTSKKSAKTRFKNKLKKIPSLVKVVNRPLQHLLKI